MDDERITDDERAVILMLDRELQRELQVDPAPDFLARVRQNIAKTPNRVRGWQGWWVPAAVAATVLIGVLSVLAQRNVIEPRPETTTPLDVARAEPVQPVTPQVPSRQPQATAPVSRAPLVATRPVPTRSARSVRDPVVLVAPDDERALLRFMALTNAGRIESSSLDSVFASSAEELVIAPIKIEPLPPLLPEIEKPAGSGSPDLPPAVNALLTGLR